MSAPRIVGRNYTEATNFALETLGLAPRTFRVTTTVGGLAGYGYTLHLAPGWSKAPYAHALRNKIKFKRNIEVIDHEASVQKESTREVEDAPDISEMHHCDGCGEDYNILEESHIGHQAETSVNLTGEPEVIMPPDAWRDIGYIKADDTPVVYQEIEPETPEETDDPTGTPESGEDAEGAEKPVQRRRRRCKTCGVLVEPDDVEAHAAEHEAE